MTDLIAKTAAAATKWWADRLQRGDCEKFAEILQPLIEHDLRENGAAHTECDYDPHGHLLTAVRIAVDPDCRGFLFSARGILPAKHELEIEPGQLRPKEGYANWTDVIEVKE